ncbi:MAG: ORF6N domain-containing protein [Blautia sp.]|nr:ORF6N domain-containing protein [Blautia sp.]
MSKTEQIALVQVDEQTLIAAMEFAQSDIKNLIYVVRNQQVMLDSDLAMLYQVETKVFNQAVKRNIARFPDNFKE